MRINTIRLATNGAVNAALQSLPIFLLRRGWFKGAIARVRVSVELTLSQPRVATVVRSRLTHR